MVAQIERAWLRLCLLVTLCAAGTVLGEPKAPGQLPRVSGLSGYLFFGPGYRRVQSNLLPGSDLLQLGDPLISSVNQRPSSGDGFYPAVTGELRYTFAAQQLQLFFGSQVENVVTLDYAQLFGIRWELQRAGTLMGAYTFSGLPPMVWADPYLEGEARQETDRKSDGFRFEWLNIFQSGMRFQLTRRKIDIGKERSGASQLANGQISQQQQTLLDRNGNDTDSNLYALIPLGSQRHVLRPELGYEWSDRDGEAMSRDRYYGKLTYAYRGSPVTFVLSGEYGRSRFQEANPIYDRKQDGDSLLLAGTLFYQLPGPNKHWSLIGNINYAEDNSDIPFMETRMFSFAAGAEFRFGAR